MADKFYGKGITVASGFDLSAKSPLDTRNVVNTIEERDAHVLGNRAYEGMKVYVLADKKEYRYNGTDWEVVGGGAGATEVSQGETEPTEESVLLWIDTTSDENIVENNLSDALLSEFRESISNLNTRITSLENEDPIFQEDMHTHSNKEVLDKITQSYFDKWTNKSEFSGSYNNLTDKPNLDIYATRTYVDTAIESMGNQNLDDYALKSEIPTSLPTNGGNADTIDNFHIWKGTQAQYDAMPLKDSNTIYIIVG